MENESEINTLEYGILAIVFAIVEYIISKYILYEYVMAVILEYASYFIGAMGILFLISWVLGKIVCMSEEVV